jgi:hypothetical protein
MWTYLPAAFFLLLAFDLAVVLALGFRGTRRTRDDHELLPRRAGSRG